MPDKEKAWEKLHKLALNNSNYDLECAAIAIGNAFPFVPNKEMASEDLHKLIQDENYYIRQHAYYSLGKSYIYKATKTENELSFQKELKNAINYFENSLSKSIYNPDNPALFCLPFYNSFYNLTFNNRIDTKREVIKYFEEAYNAIGNSKNKELLLKAVESLFQALESASNSYDKDFELIKSDLSIYYKYCNIASELLDITGKDNPYASELIKMGIPIIGVKIKEIKEKSIAVCKEMKGTAFEEYGREINKAGSQLDFRDLEGLKKSINNMVLTLKNIYSRLPEKNQEESTPFFKQINTEKDYGDKFNILLILLSKLQGVPYMSINITGNGNTVITGNRNKVKSEYLPINVTGVLQVDLEKLKQMIEADYAEFDKSLLIKKITEAEQASIDPSKKELVKNNLNWVLDKTSKIAPIGIFVTDILIHYKIL
jgi:hypothetical protein